MYFIVGQLWLVGAVCAPTIFAQMCAMLLGITICSLGHKLHKAELDWREL